MGETTREGSRDVMGGPDAPSDVLTGGVQPADADSDVMSSGADRPADVLAGDQKPTGDNPGTMAADTADADSDILEGEGEGPATPAAS